MSFESNINTHTRVSHRTDNSYAFLSRPFRRRVNVIYVSHARSNKYSFQFLILYLLDLGRQMCLEDSAYLYLFATHDVRVYTVSGKSVYNCVCECVCPSCSCGRLVFICCLWCASIIKL